MPFFPRFFPNAELNHDRSNWWVPNIDALMGLMGAAGFSDAEILDAYSLLGASEGLSRRLTNHAPPSRATRGARQWVSPKLAAAAVPANHREGRSA